MGESDVVACTGIDTQTEFEFMRSTDGRTFAQCRGPLVKLGFASHRLVTLQASLGGEQACDVLWDGFIAASLDRVMFSLCAAHWIDISCVSGLTGALSGRRDWIVEGVVLYRQVCRVLGWDAKELLNLAHWKVQLT